ncbi:hypothetical protein AC1031_002020 [Aphanomyces cochlioides]|nr:hypothetical protein AC1031_002020 [Aphanomyces cochlioides]
MSPYSRNDRWDFLVYHPSLNNKLVQRNLLSPLWQDIWKHWAKIPMTAKTPHEPTIHQMIQMPIWLSSHPLFQVSGREGTSSLAIKLKNHRDWYRHLARSDFQSLQDFLTPTRTWPTYDEFKAMMTALEDDFVDDSPIPTSFQHFYKLLTSMATDVWTQADVPVAGAVPRSPEQQSFIVFRHNEQDIPFCSWTAKILKQITFHAPPMTKKHPLETSMRPDKKTISVYLLRYVKPLSKIVTPVQADVWFRAIYDILPVSDKFRFMESAHPNAVQCCYPRLLPHREAWGPFGVRFSWDWIENLDSFQVARRWSSHKDLLHQLWFMLMCTILHLLWTHRNRVKFDNAPTPYIPALNDIAFTFWSSNVRRWLRQNNDEQTLQTINRILVVLKRQTQYKEYFKRHTKAFASHGRGGSTS